MPDAPNSSDLSVASAAANAAAHYPDPQNVMGDTGQAARFITLNISPGAEAEQTVRDFFGNAAALVRTVGRRVPARGLSMVVGIGSDAWDRLFGAPRPAKLHVLRELRGSKHTAPSTPGDILLHIRAETVDMCYELSMQALRELGEAVQPVDEVHGFRYFDGRAMIGFVDGVENPEGHEAIFATLVGEEDPGFTGGSYVITQKYLHDMSAWNSISTEEQERVIGRSKADNIEMPDDVKPKNSHVALNVVADAEGNEFAIQRANLPFANPAQGEFGTFFIGYARDPAVTELMLTNMFIGNPPGNYDRLLDFSTAVTGTLFFVPSVTLLAALADGNPLASEAAATAPTPTPAAAGTLSIGSLKGQPQMTALPTADKPGHEPLA